MIAVWFLISVAVGYFVQPGVARCWKGIGQIDEALRKSFNQIIEKEVEMITGAIPKSEMMKIVVGSVGDRDADAEFWLRTMESQRHKLMKPGRHMPFWEVNQ